MALRDRVAGHRWEGATHRILDHWHIREWILARRLSHRLNVVPVIDERGLLSGRRRIRRWGALSTATTSGAVARARTVVVFGSAAGPAGRIPITSSATGP
jgi:hypothetical protein